MKTLRNENGIALAMVLVLSAICLAVMAGLIYFITAGSQMSGIQKRYTTSLEAGTGGSDVLFQLIGNRGAPLDLGLVAATSLSTTALTCATNTSAPVLPDGRTCGSIGLFTGIATKINLPTACWTTQCSTSLVIDPASSATYDLGLSLGINPTYNVYGKIVDTVWGNSGADTGLIQGGVVWSTPELTPVSSPYYYTIEIDAENTVQTASQRERAKISILYQY